MALYLDVHKNLTGLSPEEMAQSAHKAAAAAQSQGVTLRNYWYDQQAGAIFCLCEAPSREAALAAHREAGSPAPDEIFEVKEGTVH